MAAIIMKLFPNIIKKLASDYPNENIGELDRETEVTSHTEEAQSSPSTPKRLQEVLTGKLNKLKDTPISPQGIMRNHLVKTNVRIDNLEQSIIDVREHKTNNLISSIKLYKDWTNLQASMTGSNKKMLNSLSMNLPKKP